MTETYDHVPAPGSRLAAAANAAAQAQPPAGHVEAQQAEIGAQAPSIRPVPVVRESAANAAYRVVNLAAGQSARLAGRNKLRRTATIILVGNAGIVCNSQDLANAIAANAPYTVPLAPAMNGLWLAVGTPLVLTNQEEIWIVCATSTAILASIAIEYDTGP